MQKVLSSLPTAFLTLLQIVDDTHFSVNGKVIQVVSSRDPLQLPWKALDIDLVIEGTGVFIDTKGASKHIEAGAKKVRCCEAGCECCIEVKFN